MEKIQLILIDSDPDEHLIFEYVISGLPLLVDYHYFSGPRKAIEALATGLLPQQGYIFVGISLPTPESAPLLAALRGVADPARVRIVIYAGVDNPSMFAALLTSYDCLFLPKYPSHLQQTENLISLLGQHSASVTSGPIGGQFPSTNA